MSTKKEIWYILIVQAVFAFCSFSFLRAEQGLVGWWKFDEKSGEILHDSSGKENHGKINGAIWDKDSNALIFDGNDYIDCGNDESLWLDSTITITTWVNLSKSPDKLNHEIFVVSKGGWNIVIDAPTLPCFWFKDLKNAEWDMTGARKQAPLNKWVHLAVVYNFEERTLHIYIDGILTSFKEKVVALGYFDKVALTIGGYHSGNRSWDFHGLIGETKIYNRALSSKEIGRNYLTDAKTYKPLEESVIEFLEKYIHYYPCFDIYGGDASLVADKEAVGGYAANSTGNVCYIYWEDKNIAGLKPGTYKIYIRAKGNGVFQLMQYNSKTEERIKGFSHINVSSVDYQLYYVDEFTYDGKYPLRLTDSSSGLYLDYIFLAPSNAVIE